MATTTATRRLAAILAADVAGYSRLMEADEEGTLERLKAHLSEVVDPKIREYHGRIVKTTGDGLLAEFPSVVDAVRCAGEIQRGMADRDLDVSEERRIRYRIGINLGDIIADGDDIYGDGVNIAARLEGLAAPGGICLSGTVRDQIGDRLPYAFEDMGEQRVKNIARPVRAYALRSEDGDGLPRRASPARPSGRSRVTIAAVAAAALVVVACVGWWIWPESAFFFRAGQLAEQAPPASTPIPCGLVTPCPQHVGSEKVAARPQPAPLIAPRLSIVVLPFANLSNDSDQQYLADGITEDLTTDLSRIPDMFVISSNTAFTYRNKPLNTRRIGRELGVRYVLEGSVQRSGERVRVTAELIDTGTDAHLWAERFDREIGDLLVVQDEITRQIGQELNTRLIAKEAARPTRHPDALDYILRGRAEMLKPNTREAFADAIGFFERALTLDPRSVEAQTRLAEALARRALDGLSQSRAADLARAEGLVGQALAASPGNPGAHFTKGQILRAEGHFAEAIPEYETMLKFDPNEAWALFALADCKLNAGSIEEVIPLVERAIRLTPRDPNIGLMYFRIGEIHLLQSRVAEAITWLEKARGANPEYAFIHAFLAAAYGLDGNQERAASELAEARKLQGEGSYSSIAQLNKRSFGLSDHALLEGTFFAGLRKAGVPQE